MILHHVMKSDPLESTLVTLSDLNAEVYPGAAQKKYAYTGSC